MNFAKSNSILRLKIKSVFPDFFNEDFEAKSLKELLSLRKKMYDSFQIKSVVKSCKNQYEFASLALKTFAKHGIGYEGPNLNSIDSMFNDRIALSTLESLGKVKPGIKHTPSIFDKIIEVVIPSGKMLWNMKNQVEMSQLFQTVSNEELLIQIFEKYEQMLK